MSHGPEGLTLRDYFTEKAPEPTPTGAPLPEHELMATSSTVVYRNRWMTVREDRTLRHDGAEGLYGVVHKPDFVVGLNERL